MDPKLAEMYGTNTLDDADLEKLAAAELADQLAEDGSMDLDGIDPDALEALAQEVLSDGDDGSDGDDDQVKLAEADYLGRVMAHAYVQELRGIEKEAAIPRDHTANRNTGLVRATFDEKQVKPKERGVFTRAAEGARDYAGRAAGAIRRNPKTALAGGAALAGGGAYAAHKMTKKSSALETLIEARALEILEENGFEKDAGEVTDALRSAGDTVERHARKVTDPVGRAGQRAYGAARTAIDDVRGSRTAANVAHNAHRAGRFAAEHRGKLGVGAALAAGGAAAYKMKKSSAYDGYDVLADVVEQQAWELLAASGYVEEE